MNPPTQPKITYHLFILPTLIPLLFIVLHIIDQTMGLKMAYMVGLPRSVEGLVGIILGAFVHGDFFHVLSNSLSFFLLGVCVLFFYERVGFWVLVTSHTLTGFGIWAVAGGGYHIGASGWVYALAAFLVAGGVFRKEKSSLMIALGVGLLYSGMLLTILPTPEVKEAHISWEGHLVGVCVGTLFAFIFRKKKIKILLDAQQPPQNKPTQESAEQEQPMGFRPIRNSFFAYTFKPKQKK
jgi:membrane associated rhomboid family serine protease